jgi:hypothetical protein
LLGKGGFWSEWLKTSHLSYANISTKYNYQGEMDDLEEKSGRRKLEADNIEYLSCLQRKTSSVDHLKRNNALFVERRKIVTSSMIFSENSSISFSLVYGFVVVR